MTAKSMNFKELSSKGKVKEYGYLHNDRLRDDCPMPYSWDSKEVNIYWTCVQKAGEIAC